MKRFFFAAAILVRLLSAGQPPVSAVQGRVVDAKTTAALKRAAVTLVSTESGGRRIGCLSDAEGNFAFAGIAAGTYRLEARKEGYVSGSRIAHNPRTVEVSAGQDLTALVYRMVPAAILTGRVLDDLGDPAAGAQIHVLREVSNAAGLVLAPVGMRTTDDRGMFRVSGLTRGTYFVNATYRDPLEAAGAHAADYITYGYPTVYYPSVTSVEQASPIELTEGDERSGVEIRLLRTRTFTVFGGTMNTATGQPAVGVPVALYARTASGFAGGDVLASAGTDQFGGFHLENIPAGSYGVAASAPVAGGGMVAGRARLDVSESSPNLVNLALRPGTPVKGAIRVDNDTAGTRRDWLASLAIFLMPVGGNPLPSASGSLRAAVGPDGSFEIADVPDDTYRFFFVNLPEDFYVRSVRADGQDALNASFATRNGTGEPVAVSLSSGAGRVEGTAADRESKPVAGAQVVVVSTAGQMEKILRRVAADQNGRFSVRGLPPGAYRLLAFESLDDADVNSPSFLARYGAKGTKLAVEEKGRHSVTLEVISPE